LKRTLLALAGLVAFAATACGYSIRMPHTSDRERKSWTVRRTERLAWRG